MNLPTSFFLRIVISSILCSSAQTALGATRLCSDLFPAHQDSANNLKSTVSADFLQASHLFFAATMTQASNSTSASEKSSLFAKLSSIAKFRQLSQSEFQRWMEQSKLNYVDQTFLRSEPTDRLFRLDQQKMQKLDEANVQMKLSSMQDFLGSENFMDQIQNESAFDLYNSNLFAHHATSNSPAIVLAHLKSIQDAPEYHEIADAYTLNPIFGVVVSTFPSQDPSFVHVIFDYASENNERKYLWSLQKKLQTPLTSSDSFVEQKSIAYASIEHGTFDQLHRFFSFYSPELKTITLAIITKSFGILSSQWITLIPCLDTEQAWQLPHLQYNEQRELQLKLTRMFLGRNLSLEGMFYHEKAKAFLFATESPFVTSQSQNPQKYVHIFIDQISALPEKDFNFNDDMPLPANIEDPEYHYSFSMDQGFLKLQIKYRIRNKNPLMTANPIPSSGIHPSSQQDTTYYIFNDHFQVGIAKKEQP